MSDMYSNNQREAVENMPFGYRNEGIGSVNVKPVNCDDVMRITTIEDLQSYASGQIVRFPNFAEGQPFVARVRRPSLLMLARSGRIPNSLLSTANSLFSGDVGSAGTKNPQMLGEILDICEVICEAALIQPSMNDIRNAGIELSDDQMMAIFSYTQTGVKALESFRHK